jgi:hypothetical protein
VTRMELKSLSQQSDCVGAESGCLRMLSECLGVSSMCLGVPFIALRQLGAVGGQLGRPNLPSVGWCTGQSGAPPDSHCSYSVRDLLPFLAHPTIGPRGQLAHRTLSGAHRTVWCPMPIIGATMCRAKIARPTIDTGDRWLTRQSGAPPDSPVNFSYVTPFLFLRATSSPWTTHRTVRCAKPSWSWLHRVKSFSDSFFPVSST